MKPVDLASFVRAGLGIADGEVRVAWLRATLSALSLDDAAALVDAVALAAEQAREPERELLVALVDLFGRGDAAPLAQALREEAAGRRLLGLERLLRQPVALPVGSAREPAGKERVPDYGAGRPLTLGERKSLARKGDRALLDRLLLDPHPDVIRRLLANPRLTEADVIKVASRRPARPEVLAEIVRSPRWMHRAAVRMAVLLNPDTPPEVAAPVTGLLVRQELRRVATSTHVSAAVRALCLERLERRPPQPGGQRGGDLH